MFIKCDHFKIQELVDKKTFEQFGEQAWMFFNPLALIALDGIWEFFACELQYIPKSPTEMQVNELLVTVNNWAVGGQFQFRGFRPLYYSGGAAYSQHRFGNAFDCDIKGVSAEEARVSILQSQNHPLLNRITAIEDDVNWLHFDCRNIADRIKVIKP